MKTLPDVAPQPFEGTLHTSFDLVCGLRLTQLMHSWEEMRWIYEATFLWRGEGRRITTVNEWRFVVDFKEGLLVPRFTLSMNIIVPERLGQRTWLGMDISPGAKTHFSFLYERPVPVVHRPNEDQDPYWRGFKDTTLPEIPGPFYLAEIERGASERHNVRRFTFPDRIQPGEVLAPIEFPFPVPDTIPWHHGYEMPFRDEEDQTQSVTLPGSLRRDTEHGDSVAESLPLSAAPKRLI